MAATRTPTEIAHPTLVRPKDAAAMLAVSPRTLWSLTASGSLRCLRIGRSLRYDLQDLVRWIEQQKAAGPSRKWNRP